MFAVQYDTMIIPGAHTRHKSNSAMGAISPIDGIYNMNMNNSAHEEESSRLQLPVFIKAGYWERCAVQYGLQGDRKLCPYPGAFSELTYHILKSANITDYVLRASNFSETFRHISENANRSQPVPEIYYTNEFDFIKRVAVLGNSAYSLSPEVLALDSSLFAVYDSDGPGFTESRQPFGFLRVFDIYVWLAFMAVIGTSMGLKTLQKRTQSLSHFSFPALGACLAFFIAMLVCLYRGGLLAKIITRPQPIFDDYDSLLGAIRNGQVRAALPTTNFAAFAYIFLPFNNSQTTDFTETLRNGDVTMASQLESVEQTIDRINREAAENPLNPPTITFGIPSDISRVEHFICSIQKVDLYKLGSYKPSLAYVGLTDTMIAAINQSIIRNQAALASIATRYAKVWERKSAKCKKSSESDYGGHSIIELVHMRGLLLVAGVAAAAALGALVVEFGVAKLGHNV